MTLTHQAIAGVIGIAPVGADPDDAGAWTHLGNVSDMTVESNDGPNSVPADDWPTKTAATITIPVRLIRHIVPPAHLVCEWTMRAIQEHAQRTWIAAALAEALASPRLPCPVPFPARRSSVTQPWACPPHF
ncbi:hypothetical protein ACPCSC_30450 [Streptomyces lavendulocolor]|uniref:hypothetical protein n=1 Tax=Streptomyces lavendulocolor TaxID=67316 RepID=UPI003C2E3932